MKSPWKHPTAVHVTCTLHLYTEAGLGEQTDVIPGIRRNLRTDAAAFNVVAFTNNKAASLHVQKHADGSVEQQKFNVALSCISVELLHLKQSGRCWMELRVEDPANS